MEVPMLDKEEHSIASKLYAKGFRILSKNKSLSTLYRLQLKIKCHSSSISLGQDLQNLSSRGRLIKRPVSTASGRIPNLNCAITDPSWLLKL